MPKESKYKLYNFNRIQSGLEFNIFSGNLTIVKDLNIFNRLDYFSNRHNLEKLNTYKLNV